MMEVWARTQAGLGPIEREHPEQRMSAGAPDSECAATRSPIVLVPAPAADNQSGGAASSPDSGPSSSNLPAIGNGTRLAASDRVYVVTHLQSRMVVTRDEAGKPVPQYGPDKQPIVAHTLTLRREIPKVRGKAARKADKRERARNRQHLARQAARIVAREAPQTEWL